MPFAWNQLAGCADDGSVFRKPEFLTKRIPINRLPQPCGVYGTANHFDSIRIDVMIPEHRRDRFGDCDDLSKRPIP